MKAILVIDMPEFCIDCKFMKHGICLAYKSERRMNDEEYYFCDEIKPSWCPLKPMPEKYIERDIEIETERDVEVCTHGITLGRNLLIEELEK